MHMMPELLYCGHQVAGDTAKQSQHVLADSLVFSTPGKLVTSGILHVCLLKMHLHSLIISDGLECYVSHNLVA